MTSPSSSERSRTARGSRSSSSQLESRLPAAEVTLEPEVLDRVAEIVRSGVNLNPADTSDVDEVLVPDLRRR